MAQTEMQTDHSDQAAELPSQQVDQSVPLSARRPVYHPPTKSTKPKFGKNAIGCVFYGLFAIAAIAAIVLVAVAKSGIVSVPYASQLYKGPVPTRTVSVKDEKTEDLKKAIETAVVMPTGKESTRIRHEVTYTEAELTAAAHSVLADTEDSGEAKAGKTQVVIRPDAIQLTGRFRVKGLTVDGQVEFVPSVKDGMLATIITKAQFGDLPVAPSVAKVAVDALFKRDSGVWDIDIADHEVEGVKLADGALTLMLF